MFYKSFLNYFFKLMVPLVDSFRTFCWGDIIEKLRNINKLKEAVNFPADVINPI